MLQGNRGGQYLFCAWMSRLSDLERRICPPWRPTSRPSSLLAQHPPSPLERQRSLFLPTHTHCLIPSLFFFCHSLLSCTCSLSFLCSKSIKALVCQSTPASPFKEPASLSVAKYALSVEHGISPQEESTPGRWSVEQSWMKIRFLTDGHQHISLLRRQQQRFW